MTQTTNFHIVLAVTGSIAAYKACDIIRGFQQVGCEVRVILTASAAEFITPLTLETLSGNPVVQNQLDDASSIQHIALSPWADAYVIAPATANIMAKCACGIADDIVSTTYLCMNHVPVFFAPAMNTRMWDHPKTKRNCATLLETDHFIDPVIKLLACGETGQGGLAEPQTIIQAVLSKLQ